MATAIIMPKAGMAMETGTILEWKVAIGDRIEAGAEILEIETDKVAMPVEAETSGTLIAIVHEVGAVVPVTETIGWIGEAGEQPPADGGSSAESPASDEPAPPPTDRETAPDQPADAQPSRPEPASTGGTPSLAHALHGRVRATPGARRRAQELGVELASVMPSGPSGEVRIVDVETTGATTRKRVSPLAEREAREAGVGFRSVSGSGPGGRVLRRDVVEQAVAALETHPVTRPSRRPLTGMRRTISERMTASARTIPPVTLSAVAGVDRLFALRTELNSGDERYSLNDLILAATARAVRRAPDIRTVLDGDQLVTFDAVNLGMAVALPDGLLVPVIHDADALPLGTLSRTARDLAGRARDRRLRSEDVEGATFTVTNLGMLGVRVFTPIISVGQAGILGVGAVRVERFRAADGEITDRSVIDLSLTIDHRVVDGAQGAHFLSDLIALIEAPGRALV